MRSAPRRILAALVLVLSLPAASACGPYRLAFYEYTALYYRGADGQYRGIDKDVVDELARRSGCRFETVLESRARTWQQLAAGQLDVSVSVLPTPERERDLELVPYLRSQQWMVMRRELAATLATPEAFLADRTRRLLVVRAAVYVPPLQALVTQLRAQGRVVEAPDQPTALRAFKAGRADAVILGGNSLALARARDANFATTFEALDYAPGNVSVATLAMSRQRVAAADRALLRRTLEEMVRDGSVEAYRLRHLADTAGP
jgi:polar amino acid transport system substrate-binding protein